MLSSFARKNEGTHRGGEERGGPAMRPGPGLVLGGKAREYCERIINATEKQNKHECCFCGLGKEKLKFERSVIKYTQRAVCNPLPCDVSLCPLVVCCHGARLYEASAQALAVLDVD